MNPLQIATDALSLIAQLIADARAANDDAAVAVLEALVADSAIGRAIRAKADLAQAAIDAARGSLDEDVLDVASVIAAPLPRSNP